MYLFLLVIGILIFCFFFLDSILKFYIKNINRLFLDKPNLRSMHKNPTPTGGGFSILITILISYSICEFSGQVFNSISDLSILKIVLISTPLSIISFYDDSKNISQKLRYSIQLFTGIFLLINSNFIELLRIDLNFFIFLLSLPLLLLFITGVINITNFMDGIDGLVVGSFMVIFIVLSIKFEVSLIFISFILIVFLKWNWHPAVLFMGDSGSTLLGAVFAGILISTQNYWNFLSIFLLSMPLIIDSTTCLFWRYFNGYNIFSAHKMHLYQRLVLGGFTHDKVSILYISSISFISIFYLTGNLFLEFIAVGIITLLGIYLHFKFATPLYKL